jgi:hypothetical protein
MSGSGRLRRLASAVALVALAAGTTLVGPGAGEAHAAAGDPFGAFYSIGRTGPGSFRLWGWVVDPDTTAPVTVALNVNGQWTSAVASMNRPDVDQAFHRGPNHGFDVTMNLAADDQMCVFWVNAAGAGSNQLVGCYRDSTWGTLPPPQSPDPNFAWAVAPVTAADLWASWHAGCPAPPSALRVVFLRYWGFDSQPHTGALVVHSWVVDPVVAAFRAMYEQRFPIERMDPVEAFGGSDDASMAANNTSAFNCRAVTGGTGFSQHSNGGAIDINPALNPYVTGSTVLPARGANYLDRSRAVDGMLLPRSSPVLSFGFLGWGWGGNWASPKDYQHVSSNNR